MSYGISPYRVPLTRLRRAFGSRDRTLLAAVTEAHGDEMQEHDEDFEDEIEDGAPRVAEALAEIVSGRIAHPDHAFQYAYAVEFLCRHLGEALGSGMLAEVDNRFLARIDRVLTKHRVAPSFETSQLVEGEPPVPIPRPADFPGVATFEPAEAARVRQLLGRVKTGGLDPDLADALEEIRGWFDETVKVRGCGLVIFYY